MMSSRWFPELAGIAMAAAVLLVGGVGAFLYLWQTSPGGWRSWRSRLQSVAAASPWTGRDVMIVGLLLAVGQLVRARFFPTVTGHVIAFHGLMIAAFLWLSRHKANPFGPRKRLRELLGQSFLRWLALIPVIWFTIFLWQLFLRALEHPVDLQDPIRIFLEAGEWPQRLTFILMATVLAPLAEEMFFRGLLLPAVVRAIGAAPGLFVLSLGFAALHAHWSTFGPLAVLSGALALAYAQTGSLWVTIVMHGLFNGSNLGLIWLLARAGLL